jgi:hypothetical protein
MIKQQDPKEIVGKWNFKWRLNPRKREFCSSNSQVLEKVCNTEWKFLFPFDQKKVVNSKDRYLISFTETIIWKQEIAPLIVYIRSEFLKKKRHKTSQVTTNKFNQLTLSTKLHYYLFRVSAWDETYIRTGTA